MPAIHLSIIGRVQGVCFRAETKRKANALGLTGWVRNCADGSVEVFAQGEEHALKELLSWCHRGPEGAEVTSVTTEKRPTEERKSFVVAL